MSKCLQSWERKFKVCSDCAFFKKDKPIDERYPEILYGFCTKYEKWVDNRWETECKDCTAGHTCEKFVEENIYTINAKT